MKGKVIIITAGMMLLAGPSWTMALDEGFIFYGWQAKQYQPYELYKMSQAAHTGFPLYLSPGSFFKKDGISLEETLSQLDALLEKASQRGVKVWLELPDPHYISKDKWLAGVVEITRHYTQPGYNSYAENIGWFRITLFDEANPVRPWLRGEYQIGKLFKKARQKIKEISPDCQVGIFLGGYTWQSQARTIMRIIGQENYPDFNMTDYYGYDESTLNNIRATIRAAKRINKKPTYFLGSLHTLRDGRAGSQKELKKIVKTAQEAGAKGFGWYITNRTNTQSYGAFIPNGLVQKKPEPIGPAGKYIALTAFDRDQWAYLHLLRKIRPDYENDFFDLWLYGYDFDHAEHTLWLWDFALSKWQKLFSFNPNFNDSLYSLNNKKGAIGFYLIPNHYRSLDGAVIRIDGFEGDKSQILGIYLQNHQNSKAFMPAGEMTKVIQKGELPNEKTLFYTEKIGQSIEGILEIHLPDDSHLPPPDDEPPPEDPGDGDSDIECPECPPCPLPQLYTVVIKGKKISVDGLLEILAKEIEGEIKVQEIPLD